MKLFDLGSMWGPFFFVLTGIVVFYFLENYIPFRPSTLSKWQRWTINFSLNFCNIALIDFFFLNLMKKTGIFSETYRLNLFERLSLNSFWRIAFTIIVLDLAMYLWHRLNHGVPFFWRFHRVHHTDLNVDVSTASRFHFGEVTISTIITYSFMLFLGATIVEVRIFQVALFLMAQFGHSNIKLWLSLERWLCLFLVTPNMHRVHHSSFKRETDSNYGTIFSFWDRLFGTWCRDTVQERLVFGLNDFRDQKELTLVKLILLPFRQNKR